MKRTYLWLKMFSIAVISSLMFFAGDCGTNNDNPPASTSVAAPTNIKIRVDRSSGAFAVVSWDHSADKGKSDFKGYVVNTYAVDSSGNVISQFRTDIVPSSSNSQIINSIIPLTRYKSFVYAETNNSVKSDSVGSLIYAAVWANNDSLDQFQATGSAVSGYGWNTAFGIGTRYAYTTANANLIDIHLRDEGGLRFYSPDQKTPGTRVTKFDLVGTGQEAYDRTDLLEPALTSIVVVENNVYLIKTQEGNYIKVWVKKINPPAGSRTYSYVTFDYKVQPIAGLRIVKRG
ncbi:MAG TPA: fibronectin type III domain-containing protein [Ignavibacteriaceae bacterium]|nr:fibronectin type III domain-containing protein [Ignavibacteriaceae bacterium]